MRLAFRRDLVCQEVVELVTSYLDGAHQEVVELVTSYLDGALSRRERRRFERQRPDGLSRRQD